MKITSLIFLLIWSSILSAQTFTANENINEYITVDKMNNRAILVKLYNDAVTAIATQKGIVVIDAGVSNSLTSKYSRIIEKKFNRNDFAYLINTHSHYDHVGGNQVFSDAVIIGHENCPIEMSKEWKNREKIKQQLSKFVEDYDKELRTLDSGTTNWEETFCKKNRSLHAYHDLLNDRVVTFPTTTFNDRMNLSMGDVTFNLIYFGKAHSESDIIIHIPEEKLLLVGDLFSQGGRPSFDNVTKHDAERWLIALKWIKARWGKIDKIIGGHGKIMSKENLELFSEYVKQKYDKLK
jgi:glyoxylase-like metal-dependent hydrolase (beta-lactamase superfamily II)